MPRLLSIAAALVALSVPGTAYAAPVSQVPAPSPVFDGPVHTAVYSGSVIYLGGEFTHATVNGMRIRRTRLAAVDAHNGALLNWTPTADNTVTGMAADSTGIYIAGDFKSISGVKRDSLAKLDGFSGAVRPTFSHKISGHPNAIAVGHGRVYLGGTLTAVDSLVRNRVAAFDAVTGALDAGWAPVVPDVVMTILPTSDRVYLGGRFDSVNGAVDTQKLAAVTPDTGVVIASFVSKIFALVHELAVANGVLYAGVDGNGGKAMAVDALTGAPKWTITTDGDVQTIAVLDDVVYLGGHFDNVCRTANIGAKGVCLDGSDKRVKLAALDLNGVLLPWTANGNGTVGVRTLVANPAKRQLLAGGEFTAVNGVPQKRFALFNLL